MLEHAQRGGLHYDWLLEDPRDPAGPLVAFRVAVPWEHWARTGAIMLTALPPHRRRYLDYQGPLSGARGSVRRVGRGLAGVRRWECGHAALELRLAAPRAHALGTISMSPIRPGHWRGKILTTASSR